MYTAFKDYDVYLSKATKLSRLGRKSGGVLVFVRNNIAHLIKQIDVKYDHMIVLELCCPLIGTERKRTFILCSYVHPYDSKYWDVAENGFGMEVLEQCIIDLYEKCNDLNLIICGDLNARTGSENAAQMDNDFENMIRVRDENENFSFFKRKSDDKEINGFGRDLLDMCSIFDCIILNGLTNFGYDDSLTYVSPTGGSTIDYVIVSRELCEERVVGSLEVLSFVDSGHFPVTVSLNLGQCNARQKSSKVKEWHEKIVWDSEKEHIFAEQLLSDPSQDIIQRASELVNFNTDQAVELFTNVLLRASDCMRKRVCVDFGGEQRQAAWFDEECKQAKRKARQLLNKFRNSKLDVDRELYVSARKEYRNLIKKKKTSFKREKARQLTMLRNNGKMFWKEIRQLSGKRKSEVCKDITNDQWLDHFQKLFNANRGGFQNRLLQIDESETNNNGQTCHELNQCITKEEVNKAIRNLKNGKACGVDEISAEMLKTANDSIVSFLTKLFNKLFDEGEYPTEWSKAIIVPIFKKGDISIPDNYRGVSLLSLVSKCYTYILNTRLVKWVEQEKKLTETQAGFRKGYSTVDHIFTLNAIVEKRLQKKGGKLYACFVDLRKAFDSVHHEPLFEVLHDAGLRGKFINALTAIYKSVKSCVRNGNRLTEFFECPVGVRQGCILSPMLFSLFINEVANMINEGGTHGIQLLPGLIELYLLLFADDIVLMSDTPRGLQNQINILNEACKNLYLCINGSKTKVMVFRKGGFLGKNEKWFLGNDILDIVNEYNYLGYVFTTKMSITKGVNFLALKGKRACVDCVRHLNRLNDISCKCFFKIFDTQVKPVLLYGAEMWGAHRLLNIERVHSFACKRYLNVPLKIPNKFVYGELARYPLYVDSVSKCIGYWLKLLTMDRERLPKQAYQMLLNMDEKGNNCWATCVKNLLFSLGFGYAWINQGVGCEKVFLSLLKQRLIDVYIQEWNGSITTKDMYENYRMFKLTFVREDYFDYMDIKCFRDCLVKLRLGILPINGSAFNCKIGSSENNRCNFCRNVIESESHFVFKCPLYADIRQRYLNEMKIITIPALLKIRSASCMRKISMYLFNSLKRRKEYVDACGDW